MHVNMATVSVAFADEFAALHAKRGIDYIAAPVMGRPDAAAAGKLHIMAAGPTAAIEKVQPLFDVAGQKTWRFGEIPSRANVVKISMNFMLAAACEAMGEAAALATGYDIKAGDLFDLASHSLFPGPVYEGYGRLIAAGTFEPALLQSATRTEGCAPGARGRGGCYDPDATGESDARLAARSAHAR